MVNVALTATRSFRYTDTPIGDDTRTHRDSEDGRVSKSAVQTAT
mgnify:CR=1 FL=1|jgi:hypothetical protein